MAYQKLPERDWKQLKALKDTKLNTACEWIFEKIENISKDRKGQEHKSYLELWKMLHEEDDDIGIMFNDLKRSNAIMKLVSWRTKGLLSDEDLKRFTEETQDRINSIVESYRIYEDE